MQQGLNNALALLSEHGERLHALLFRLTLRADVAEDLMQELFCKLAASSGFHRATSQLGYAIRMATNLAFDFRRRQQRGQRAETARAMATVNVERSPLDALHERDEVHRLLDAMDQLQPASRDVLVLRYLEQEDYEAIARKLGKSAHQVRSLCHKAIVTLRKLLDDRGRPEKMRSREHE